MTPLSTANCELPIANKIIPVRLCALPGGIPVKAPTRLLPELPMCNVQFESGVMPPHSKWHFGNTTF